MRRPSQLHAAALLPAAALLVFAACGQDRVRGLEAEAAAPASIDFGQVAVGAQKTLSVDVRNLGAVSLQILSARASSPFTAQAADTAIAAGGAGTVQVTLAPTAPGDLDVPLELSLSSAVTPSLTVRLKGTAYQPDGPVPSAATLSVTPDSLSFLANAPAVAGPQTVTLTNSGDLGLTWTAAIDGAELALSAASGELAGHASAHLSIDLAAGASGSLTRHLTVTAKAAQPIAPVVVPISITALANPGPAAMRVEPSTLAFTSKLPGLPAAQVFRVHNVGGSALHWSVSLGGAAWLSAGALSGVLAPAAVATVSVQVTTAPVLPQTLSQVLTVSSPEAASQTVTVTASFTPPAPPPQYGGSVWPKFHQGNSCTGLSSVATATRGVVRFKSKFGASRLSSFDGTYVGSPALAEDGTVYQVGSDGFDGSVTAFEPLHGARKWSTVITAPASISPSIEATPTVVKDGSVFVMTGAESAGTHFYKLDKAGKILWSDQGASGYGDGFDSSPAIGADGTMWLAYDESPAAILLFSQGDATSPPHEIARVNIDSGSDIEAQSGAIGDDGTAYWADDGKLEVLAKDGRLWRHDATDGEFQWIHSRSAPALTLDGAVVFAYANTNFDKTVVHTVVTAVTSGRGTGRRLWRTVIADTAPIVPLGPTDSLSLDDRLGLSSPAVGPDGTIYVGGGNGLYALDRRTGAIKWRAGAALVSSSPAVGADGTVFFGSADGKLTAASPAGKVLWTIQTGGSVNSSPAIGADGAVFVASDDGYLYAVE